MPDIPAPIPPEPKTPPQPVVTLHVGLLPDGNVTVTGPLTDFPLMVKMLGGALQAAAQYAAQQKVDGARLVQAAPAGALHLLNGR